MGIALGELASHLVLLPLTAPTIIYIYFLLVFINYKQVVNFAVVYQCFSNTTSAPVICSFFRFIRPAHLNSMKNRSHTLPQICLHKADMLYLSEHSSTVKIANSEVIMEWGCWRKHVT